jgi:thiol-disulfide isomerase/thioredoxin
MSQSIVGQIPQAVNTEIVLIGYEGFEEKELAKTITDTEGKFNFSYPREYIGAALLKINNVSNLIVLLNKENFEIQWNNIKDLNTLQFHQSPENDFFAKGIKVNQDAEQKLAGLKYLLPLYQNNKTNENWLQNEIKNQEQTFEKFIEELPKNSNTKQYLQYRKFLGDVQLTLDRYKAKNRLLQHEIDFKKIDFTDEVLWNSGLLKDLLNGYYQVLTLFEDKEKIIKKGIEANQIWLKKLENNPIKQKEIAEYCFTLFEKKSLTQLSEHIALSMLNNSKCILSDKQTNLFEQYRKLSVGRTAPNINLNDTLNLKELKSDFKLVVFGATWCPQCQTDYPSLVGEYKKIKEKYNIEVIYISLDTDMNSYNSYFKDSPFITYCDGKGWETVPAKDYFVSATPSYYLLDKELRIIAKPIYPKQIIELLNSM